MLLVTNVLEGAWLHWNEHNRIEHNRIEPGMKKNILVRQGWGTLETGRPEHVRKLKTHTCFFDI